MNKLCVINVGHSKKSPGAKSSTGITEFSFNDDLAQRIKKLVKNVKIERVYQKTLKHLPDQINALNPSFIISLHCNAFFLKASGTETLYYHLSDRSKQIAAIIQKHLVKHLGLPDRKTIGIKIHDRGGYLLYHTKAPAVICEPFFIDNLDDYFIALNDMDGLAQAYANAIDEISDLF